MAKEVPANQKMRKAVLQLRALENKVLRVKKVHQRLAVYRVVPRTLATDKKAQHHQMLRVISQLLGKGREILRHLEYPHLLNMGREVLQLQLTDKEVPQLQMVRKVQIQVTVKFHLVQQPLHAARKQHRSHQL
jgi:hypothetical protein